MAHSQKQSHHHYRYYHWQPDNWVKITMITTFITKQGHHLCIRKITDDDAGLLVDMYNRLSEQTRRFRFHAVRRNLSPEALQREAVFLSHLDPQRQVALIALLGQGEYEQAVGVARFSRATPTAVEAENAVVVRDDFQNMGLGTCLLTLLVTEARQMGIQKFCAWVLPENQRVLKMVKKSGFPSELTTHRGETFVIVYLTDFNAPGRG